MNHFGKIQTMFVIKSKQDLNLNQSQSLKMITLKDISILLMNLKKKEAILTQTMNLQTMNLQTLSRYMKNHITNQRLIITLQLLKKILLKNQILEKTS